MGTTAELNGKVSCLNDTDNITVLLAEQCHRAQLLCLINRHFLYLDRNACQNGIVCKLLCLCDLLISQRSKVREIEADMVCIGVRTCLLNVRTQNHTQCLL